jgi:hypothetical protein
MAFLAGLAGAAVVMWNAYEGYSELRRTVESTKADLAEYKKEVALEEMRKLLTTARAELDGFKAIDPVELKRTLDALKLQVAIHQCALAEQTTLNGDVATLGDNISDSLNAFKHQMTEKPERPGSDGKLTQLSDTLERLASKIQAALNDSKASGAKTEGIMMQRTPCNPPS